MHLIASREFNVASRIATGTAVIVVSLPLAAGLALGSLVSAVTLVRGKDSAIWQLTWWSSASVIIGATGHRVAREMAQIISRKISYRYLARVFGVMRCTRILGVIVLAAGLATSIWVIVEGKTFSGPIELYWPLPIGAFLFFSLGPIRAKVSAFRFWQLEEEKERLQQEKEHRRKARCTALTPHEITEYQNSFLMTLHSLALKERSARISGSHLRDALDNECTPELWAGAMDIWRERECITADNGILALSEIGARICRLAKVRGMEAALDAHYECLSLSDADQVAYRDSLLMQIASLAGDTGRRIVSRDELTSTQDLPCTYLLATATLRTLSSLGLVDLTRPAPRTSDVSRRLFSPSAGIGLTELGIVITSRIPELGTLDLALEEHEGELQRERERHDRCVNSTDVQRVEFENQFLMALYGATAGDTRPIELGKVWSRLRHECAPELTKHAINVWRERSCVVVGDRFVVYEKTKLSITAAGRDLCMRAMILGGNVEAALHEREGNYKVKNEYNFQTANVVGTNAHVHDNEFALFVNTLDQTRLDRLAQELSELRVELLKTASTPEEFSAIGAISDAELAAREHDAQRVWHHLARAGRWALETANQIGISVAVETILSIFKALNIPIS